jgi:hypothetical protein
MTAATGPFLFDGKVYIFFYSGYYHFKSSKKGWINVETIKSAFSKKDEPFR